MARVAVVAPSPVPYRFGGAERLWDALITQLRLRGDHAELLKLPTRELRLAPLLRAYADFSALDLSHFDTVITGKYPAWSVTHPHHVVWMLHPLRGLYDRRPGHLGEYVARRTEPELVALVDMARDLDPAPEALARQLGELADMAGAAASALGDQHPELQIPSVVAGEVVHAVDRACLAPGRVAQYAAISRAVAVRPGWMPEGQPVQIVMPPLGLPSDAVAAPERTDSTATTRFLVVGRLEAPKRIDLAIDAALALVRDGGLTLTLDVVGDGPMADELRARAGANPAIVFHGGVDDATLAALYDRCDVVVFTPDREDFGYVALEAMSHSRPVIVTNDSDGPLELVTDGITGWVVEPTVEAVAAAMRNAVYNPEQSAHMGEAAADTAARITWPNALTRLLSATPSGDHDGPSVVALSTYPIHPRAQGGPLRAYHLAKGLAAGGVGVHIISLTVDPTVAGTRLLAERVTETSIAVSALHTETETKIRLVSGPVAITDIAASLLHRCTPAFHAELGRRLPTVDAVMLIQPYLVSALDGYVEADTPVVIDAHNNEALLKAELFTGSEGSRWLLDKVQRCERQALERSDAVVVTTEADGDSFVSGYGTDPARIHVIANGADVDTHPFVTGTERVARRRNFLANIGAEDYEHLAVFVGSGHQPNIDAAQILAAAARDLPKVAFAFLGRHSDLLGRAGRASNVFALGQVDRAVVKEALAGASVGLNPMLAGSGSNLKLTAYFSAGAPAVSTVVGARGIESPADLAVLCEPAPAAVARAVTAVLEDPTAADERALRARRYVEDNLDWSQLGAAFAQIVRHQIEARK